MEENILSYTVKYILSLKLSIKPFLDVKILRLEETSYISRVVREYGRNHNALELSEVVMDLFHAALRSSSLRTYRTGQRAYSRFLASIRDGTRFPFKRRLLTETELNLAFFMAFLLLEPTVNKASTILNYETHVKYLFRTEGCPVEIWDTPFLGQIRRGLKNTLPSSKDGRRPLLLPEIMFRPEFLNVVSSEQRLLRFATILGFIGMLRPHSLETLEPSDFYVITKAGDEIRMPRNQIEFRDLWARMVMAKRILGFYIKFRSKTMNEARAYFPTLSAVETQMEFSLICPVSALTDISRRGLMSRGFLKALNKQKRLTHYLQYISRVEKYIAPYALRIGGRTWLLTQGLDRQFVDFLGTWTSPEASARYYRAAPRSVLNSLQRFYCDVARWP